MYQQDYILRIIAQMGAFLRAMLAAIREHRPEEALETSREALGTLTGLSPGLAEALSAEGLLALLSAGGRLDAKRALLAAEVAVVRGEAFEATGEEERGAAERHKAIAVLAAVRDEGGTEDVAEAERLLGRLG